MPFPKATNIYEHHRDLSDISSEIDSEQVGFHFEPRVDDMSNSDITPVKNLGFTQKGTNVTLPGAKRGLGIGAYVPSTGAATGGVFAAWDDANIARIWKLGAADPSVQTSVSTSAWTKDDDVEFEQVNDTLYATNGIDRALKMDIAGTWSSAPNSAPFAGAGTVAKYLKWHNFMLFGLRTVTNPNALYVSNAGDPETYTATSQPAKTFKFGGVGMQSLGEYLIVATERGFNIITGFAPEQLSYREVAGGSPCVSHRSMVAVPNYLDKGTGVQDNLLELFYLGADYVWAFNGSTFRILGKHSWEHYRDTLNTTKLNIACAYYDARNRQYRLAVCSEANTRNNKTLAYDIYGDCWVEMPQWSMCAVTSDNTSPIPSYFWQESTAVGKVFEANAGFGTPMPITTLAASITSLQTAISVASNVGFPASGWLMSESEAMTYTDKGTTSVEFNGLIRGSGGTDPVAHSSVATDIQIPPKFKYTTKFLDSGQPDLWKRYKFLWTKARASTSKSNIDIYCDIDELGISKKGEMPLQSSGAVWGAFNWGAKNWGSPVNIEYPDNRIAISDRGRSIKLSWEENTNLGAIELLEFEYRWRPAKIR
jgi:hypothetical protein